MSTMKPLPDLAQTQEALQEIEKKYDEGTRIAQTRQVLEKNENIAQNKDVVTGHIYFDEHRNAMKPFPFGVYLQRKLISAPIRAPSVIFQQEPQRHLDPGTPGRFGVGIAGVPGTEPVYPQFVATTL